MAPGCDTSFLCIWENVACIKGISTTVYLLNLGCKFELYQDFFFYGQLSRLRISVVYVKSNFNQLEHISRSRYLFVYLYQF